MQKGHKEHRRNPFENIAKGFFIKAKQDFEKVYDKNHNVFRVIDAGLERCKI